MRAPKPRDLYVAGNVFKLTRHQPPPPLGDHYPSRRTKHVNQFLQAHSQLDVCLMLPPIEGPQPDGFQHDVIQFEITRAISVKDGHGSQVVLGIAQFPTTAYTLVAKIYDPLFYPGPGPNPLMVMAHGVDFTDNADRHYSREAAAYTELDQHLGGQETLRYYGSWTCDVPVDEEQCRPVRCRPVRLILLEYISGLSMLDTNPQKYLQNQRYEILAQLIEAGIKVIYHGVRHRDHSPRNTLIETREDGSTRVVILDFADSVTHRFARLPVLKDYISLPNPPYNHCMQDYWQWTELGWDELPIEWMEKRWGNAGFTPPPEEYQKTLRRAELIKQNSYVDKLPSPDSCPVNLVTIPLGLRDPISTDPIRTVREPGDRDSESWVSSLIKPFYSYLPSVFGGRSLLQNGDHSRSDTASGEADSSSDW